MKEDEMKYIVQFTTITCATCKIQFMIPELARQRYQDRGDDFHCPNGHSNHYRESELDRVKKQLAQANSEKDSYARSLNTAREYIATKEKQLSAAKGRITKLKNKYEPEAEA